MIHRLSTSISTALAAALVLSTAGCGKGTKDQSPRAEAPTADGAGAVPVPTPETKGQAGGPAAPGKAPARAEARGPERVAYSLVDNRLAGHLSRDGGLLLAGGSAGFAKYVRVGNLMKKDAKRTWDLRQTEGGIKVARLTGKTGTLFVPLTTAQAGRPVVRMRLFAKEAGALSVRVNDNKDLNAQVTEGWSTVELTVPAGQLKAGENAVQLFLKSSGAALAWAEVGAPAGGEDPAVAFYDAPGKALTLPKGGGMSWYVVVPPKGRLTADLADGACSVQVLATADDGTTREGKLTGLGSAVDLGGLSGKAVRLDLDAPAAGCAKAALANAALVVPGEAPVVKRGDAPKYVLFIIMDSLRADRIRTFNPKARAETPVFDKLAESSTLFVQHYVQGNESQVSHASKWTSMYLAKHKATQWSDTLPERYTTIDDVAKKAGKFVAGVSANGYIRPARGFGNAWNKYVNHIESKMGLKGADVIEKGLSFIEPQKTQPWFLYLGTIDTHVTWRAKSPWIEKYAPGYKGRFATQFGDDGGEGFGKNLTDAEKEHVRALYDSNVSYQDDQLGKLIAKLEEWGVWKDTMLIITADHGDEQWEDGRVGHAGSQKETLIHVPLVIHYPPMFPAGRIDSGTEGVDITPTLADALGVAFDPEWQGMSLIPLANGALAYPLISVSSQYENFHGGRIGSWKLRLAGTGTPQLYNLASDPGERKDLWAAATPSSAIGARLLLDPMWMFRQWNIEWKKSQWGNPAVVSSRFAADLGE